MWRKMKKIIVSIIVMGLLLTTSIVSVNAAVNPNEEQAEVEGTHVAQDEAQAESSGSPTSNNPIEYWGICVGGYEETHCTYAEMTKHVLCTHGLKEDHVKLLTGINATKNNLFDTLSWINESADENDIVLLWFFSHGSIGYFGLYGNALAYSELDEKLDLLVVDKIGVVIEACYSGSAIPELNQSGRIIITSCRANEGSGTFINYCLCALQGFGGFLGDNDCYVSLEEMFNFLMQHQDCLNFVPQIADNIPGELNVSLIDRSDKNPDQFQNLFYAAYATLYKKISRAQSFEPTLDKINKVTLFLGRSGHPGPLKVSIRKELNGEDLTSVQVPEESVIPWQQAWIAYDFYFPEIDINPEEEYYIVCEANEGELYDRYMISISSRDEFDAYEKGSAFYNDDGEWHENINNDLCFATFYFENQAPNPPVVDGPTIGAVGIEYEYTFVTTDPDDDDVYYYIEWDDDEFEDWFGPFASGDPQTVSHTWDKEGDHIIKARAKDVYGAESDWGYLEVEMPVNQQSNPQGNPSSNPQSSPSGQQTTPASTTTSSTSQTLESLVKTMSR